MIYVSQLHAGDWYVTGTGDDDSLAVHVVAGGVYLTRADAENAAQAARSWAGAGRYRIMAHDIDAGQEVECFVWCGSARRGIARAMNDAREFGRSMRSFRAVLA